MSKGKPGARIHFGGSESYAATATVKKHHNPERSKFGIFNDILISVREFRKATKTRIMQRSCLDWRSFNRHFTGLLEQGFVAKCNPEEGKYELTSKGRELLRRLKDIGELWKE